ncbi:MAG: creatininase family protein [Chloroflexi bacterium]|nr:creatininase family protein [Chloroflexota bacterium]
MKLLAEMSWEEIQEYLAREDRMILPFGATEQHGPHLGLGTDTFEAEAIARAVGEKTNLVVAPTLCFGMSHHHLAFTGTISLQPATLIAVVQDILRSVYRHGFRRVMIVNGHGGNEAAITSAIHQVTDELPQLRAKIFQWWSDADAYRVVIDMLGAQAGSHASPGETSFMLAIRPEAVKLNRLKGRDARVQSSRELMNSRLFPQKYPDGIMGLNPNNATRAVGEALLKKSVEICARELEEWQESS